MLKRILYVSAMASLACPCSAEPGLDYGQRFVEAMKLAEEGKSVEAFHKYAAIAGGEYAAVEFARGEAGKYLAFLQADVALLDSPRGKLIEAELLLVVGRKDDAKERFRALSTSAAKDNWGTGQPGYYPVEPPGGMGGVGLSRRQPASPYFYGPGSHRDNGFLRRLIAFDLMDEAAHEFARLWEVHRVASKQGFNSLGLQFALDYAFFLKRTDRAGEARDVLLEPMRVMDMDRDPNFRAFQPMAAQDQGLRIVTPVFTLRSGRGLVGVARKEFIRLAFGEFKATDQVAGLADGLQQQIVRGENRARRVLAQVKLHQGNAKGALSLELAYIEHGNFNPVSSAYRRGLLFDANNMAAEAVTAFEQVLSAEPGAMRVPDSDEQITGILQFSNSDIGMFGNGGSLSDVENRLQRLYAAVGRMDKVLELQFKQFDANERLLDDMYRIDEMAVRFKAAGQEARFTAWATAKLAIAKSPRARANLACQIGDYPAAIQHAAAAYSGYYAELQQWCERFAKADEAHRLGYLRAIVKAHPGDAIARLELLELEGNLDGVEAIEALEILLATDADKAFPDGRQGLKRTIFAGYYELTARLMRLYEMHGRLDDLRALGLRLAKGEKPFGDFESHGYESIGRNGREQHGNAALALAVKHAVDPAYQSELASALATSRWIGARSQLARRAGMVDAATKVSSPWANLPPGTRVIASCESVACVARGERFVYAGLPWGVAVYDFKGTPVTRILLGRPVTHLVAEGDQLWVGTGDGLFRIMAETWAIQYQPLSEIDALCLDGDHLWIGVGEQIDNGLMMLNRHTLAMRTFSAEEIGIERTLDFTRFEADGRYLWADNYHGLLRYDRTTDAWSKPQNPGPRDPVHLIGIIDGQVWADVWINDEQRHRPARLDRDTLELTPLKLRIATPREDRMINSRIFFLGYHKGQPVFGGEGGQSDKFVVEGDTIRRLREGDDPETMSDPLPEGVILPDGKALPIPVHAWPDGLRAGVRSTRWSELWPSGAVWAVVFDDERKQDWLCVGAGLAVMPRDGKNLRHFGSAEGLTLGPMLDGVELGGKLYFASAWDDHCGSLTDYDPKTGVFTPWFRMDGMDSDKVVGMAAKNGLIEIRYGVDYPGDNTDNHLPPGTFDPATGKFTSGGKERIRPVEGNLLAPAANGVLPVLGGAAYRSYERNGKTWHCGAHGLVIYPGKDAPVLKFTQMKVRHIPSPIQVLRDEARKFDIPDPIPAALLKELVKHPNRYVRFRAVKSAYGPLRGGQADEYAPILLDCADDAYPAVRALVVWVLSQCGSQAALPVLRAALDDTDPHIGAMATVAMAKLGEVPPLEFFKGVISNADESSSFRYDDDSSFSVGAQAYEIIPSLAPHADRKIFEFLVTIPPPNPHYVGPVYPALGESLRKHPDAAEVLLAVQDEGRRVEWRDFVQSVFQHAGKEMLGVLHEALAGDDRVVRSNAARACGAIGDASSVPHLLKSLDMESGLSRASIVWALGELKASEAIPQLIALHRDERNAERNRSEGSGILHQNTLIAGQGEYAALTHLGAIGNDWDELDASTVKRPRDPARDEELLTPDHILEAVRKIGTDAVQKFYRGLAGASHPSDRYEAACGLAQPDATGREENMEILRNLLADSIREVRMSACVSLHLLGEPGLSKILQEGDAVERDELLKQMIRLSDMQLEPMRKEIEAVSTSPKESEYTRRLARSLKEKIEAKP